MQEGYATMFPLYRAEYLNIVEFVKQHFPSDRQEQLLSVTEERPRRCPFLAENNHCSIYSVRPLICRTYAVMNQASIAEAAARHRGQVPDSWIKGFTLRESGMMCPRVAVTQPQKLARHAHNLLTGVYENTLTRLSRKMEFVKGERKQTVRKRIGRALPMRWTWGGFNALALAPLAWARDHLAEYWKTSQLADTE